MKDVADADGDQPASNASASPSEAGVAGDVDLAATAAGGPTEPGSPVASVQASTMDSAVGWSGEGRTGGWSSPQRRVESWMSELELSQADKGGLGDVSSVMGSERTVKSFEVTSARPDSRGSVFSAESMSEQSLAMQRSTHSASWNEYCAALLRTGHCKHAAVGGEREHPTSYFATVAWIACISLRWAKD